MEDYGSLSPLALALLMMALASAFMLPRRMVVVPFFCSIVLMTIGQAVQIFGANFYFLRIVILASALRVIVRREAGNLELNSVDKAFICWVAYAVVVGFVPKFRDPREILPPATFTSVFINRSGFSVDTLCSYFVLRCLVRSVEDIVFAIRTLVVVSLVVAGFMLVERTSGHNLFSVLGAVPEVSAVRNGRFRCQGPFTHAIHAGNFGATLMPLCMGLWFFGRKKIAAAGLFATTVVTVLANSSGALMAWVYGMGAFLFWPTRNHMHLVRRAIVVLVIVLHLVMEAPVWWAVSRVADFTGGGGYWRSKLIDQYINHISEWWLIGTNYTASWSPTGSGLAVWPDHMDLTNQFVSEGVNGGIVQVSLYLLVVVRAFQRIGVAVHLSELQEEKEKFIYWCLGCGLVSYMAAFLSVSGSMQTEVLYFSLLAFISAGMTEVKPPVFAESLDAPAESSLRPTPIRTTAD